jgi:hypothetical protein
MAPLQPLVHEDLADAAPFDGDALLFVEVGLEAIQRPAAERQAQALGIGQGGGDDFGALLGGIGVGPARARAIIEAGQALLVEAVDPCVDIFPTDVHLCGDGTGALPVGGGQEDPGALDEAGRCGAGVGELLKGVTLLGGQGAERDLLRGWHGCISRREDTRSTSGRWRRFTYRIHH